jgi:hypothetical protein
VGSKPGSSPFHLIFHFHHFTAEPQRLPYLIYLIIVNNVVEHYGYFVLVGFIVPLALLERVYINTYVVVTFFVVGLICCFRLL